MNICKFWSVFCCLSSVKNDYRRDWFPFLNNAAKPVILGQRSSLSQLRKALQHWCSSYGFWWEIFVPQFAVCNLRRQIMIVFFSKFQLREGINSDHRLRQLLDVSSNISDNFIAIWIICWFRITKDSVK